MRIRNEHDGTEAVDHTTEDRDLIAFINEAQEPAEIERITGMARARQRARRREAGATASHQPSRRRGHLFGRDLSLRH